MRDHLGGAVECEQLYRKISTNRGDVYNHPTSPTSGYMWDEKGGEHVSKTIALFWPLPDVMTVNSMC